MGYLVITLGFLPKIIGVLLIIGCLGYLLQFTADILFPNSGVSVYVFTSFGEALLPLWLVIRGIDVERWNNRVLAAA